MLTAQIQSYELDFERTIRESLQHGPNSIPPHLIPRYLGIRNSCDEYTFKQSRFSNGCGSFPCSKKCMPRLENEVFMSEAESRKLGCFSKVNKYLDIGPDDLDTLCFMRCGDNNIPSVDKGGSIDVRLFGPSQYERYYEIRPLPLFRKDVDIHPESMEIHRLMMEICKQNKKNNLAEKILRVI
jgi:hypothetical protein